MAVSPGQRRAGQRHVDASSTAAIASTIGLVPVWLVSMLVFWWPVHLLVPVPFWAAAGGYLLVGTVLLSRRAQRVFLGRVLGARAPTTAERRVIEPLWQDVLMSARLSPAQFVLAVSESDDLNAFASGGHLVVITTEAIASLPPHELQGVLAHELGHHLGFYGVALTVGYWLALPVMALARAGMFCQNVAIAATETFASGSTVLTAIGRVVGGALRIVALPLLASLAAWQAVGGIIGRSAEFRADQRAVELGYGLELAAAMRRSAPTEPPAASRTWRERLFGSHPPLRTRVARVEAAVRRVPVDDETTFDF